MLKLSFVLSLVFLRSCGPDAGASSPELNTQDSPEAAPKTESSPQQGPHVKTTNKTSSVVPQNNAPKPAQSRTSPTSKHHTRPCSTTECGSKPTFKRPACPNGFRYGETVCKKTEKGCQWQAQPCQKVKQDNTLLKATTCKTGGCSGTLCLDASAPEMVSTCEYKPEYACYKKSVCERNSEGQCAWRQSEAFTQCLQSSSETM